jgi:pimeloyl-ACP methyl ester carboxylesterase
MLHSLSVGWFTVRCMANFVLVPGAWLGAWAWDEVAVLLRGEGHGVYPVTLSGLAERRGADAGQQQHVEDILAVVESQDLRDVVLAGHSYSGIPVGQAAGRIGDRLRQVVYVDSNIPTDGKSFVDGWSEEGQAWVREQLEASGGYWPPLEKDDYADQDLSDEAILAILERGTPHPGRSISEPAELVRAIGELPTTYLKCLMDGATPSTDVLEQLKSPSWELVELDTGHWPMFSQPAALAQILSAVVRRPGVA